MAWGLGEHDVAEEKIQPLEIPTNDFDELPDDSGNIIYQAELPDDSGEGNPCVQKIEDKSCYYDDNGILYRVDNDLIKNGVYEINGYKYTTDALGRIASASGPLHLKTRDGRLSIRDSIEDIGKGDQKDGDDRGHLIADQFDGSSGLENMIAQDAGRNRNDYKNFENELAREVKAGKEVFVKIDVVYDGDSRRPSNIVVTYTIDGETSVRIFPNNPKEN